jgi:hypothetical protein
MNDELISPHSDSLSDPTEFQTVLKTFDGKKQLHIIGVEQHRDVGENHRYSVDKSNEIQWSEMILLNPL